MVIARVGSLAGGQATRVTGIGKKYFSGERVGLNSGFGSSTWFWVSVEKDIGVV